MCGILGIVSTDPSTDISKLIFYALLTLQHRGQEGAGIAVTNGTESRCLKKKGMVSHIFTESDLQQLKGHIGVGHTRYSTYGSNSESNEYQPFKVWTKDGELTIVFNGTLTEADKLRTQLLNQDKPLQTSVDTEIIANLVCNDRKTWIDRIKQFMKTADSAFSCCFMTKNKLYACRDQYGFRPLSLGRLQVNGGFVYIVSSETAVFQTLGASCLYEIEPGCIVELGNSEPILHYTTSKPGGLFCAFESVYFARPDSEFQGKLVHHQRQLLGAKLYEENQNKFKEKEYILAGVPDSATPFAIGFIDSALKQKDTRFLLSEVFTKNRYIHRTFIQPTEAMRKTAVQSKFNPLVQNIKNKNVILIDDSIVRGNTIRYLIQLVREAGANQVHVLVGSPPIISPCFMGIDMKSKKEMIANETRSVDLMQKALKPCFSNENHLICKLVGADSLGYLSLGGLQDCLGDNNCFSCWTGVYHKTLDW